jgi:hypothetical protein
MGGKKHFLVLFLLFVFVAAIAGCGGGVSQTPAGGSGAAGAVTLAWNAPTTNTNGTALTNLAGYKIHYGTSSHTYTATFAIRNVTNYSFALPAGTYYFAVSAFDSLGLESGLSNEVAKAVL